MNIKFKRLLSAFMASAIVMSIGITAPLAEDTLPTDGLLMNITFDEKNAGNTSFEATLGGTVTKKGSVSLVNSLDEESGKAMSITSNAAGNYLELPKGILNGKEAATFSFWIKPSSGWAFMTTPVSGAQDYLNEKYLGMLATSSTLTTERYNNSGTRLSSVITNGTYMDWQYVTAVFTANGTKVYVNGQLVGSDTAKVDIKSLMTANASTWIGHGNWGTGEGFSGIIDDFRIYGRALNESEITALAAKAVQRETDKMIKEKNCLEIDTQFYNTDGQKIFQCSDNSPITVTASVTNYTTSDSKIKFSIIPYDAQGNAGEDLVKENGMSYKAEGNDVVVTIPTLFDRKVSVIAAAYENNTLSNVVIENKAISTNDNTVTLKNVKKSESETVRAYVWDSLSSLRPADSRSAYLETMDNAVFSVDITPDSNTAYYKVVLSDTISAASYDAGYLPVADVSFPDATPQDTIATTHAAHDPSIFKDPKTGIYYAYNSGNAYVGTYTDDNGNIKSDDADIDCFRSTDLIHWERIDCNFRNPESAKTHINTIFAGRNSVPNDQSWAPDILYVESDTEHPYWLYYSLSTTGTDAYVRSVIGLVKGESPTGPWTDCGVVISSEKGYNTNAIDSNIYTDTNGDRYLVWGSYQRGIHQLKLREDGLAEGIDYSSIQSIHSSSKTGTRLFSTPDGTQGPEGPWMINNTDTNYRYMFVSCGWLATTYNVRVARNSLDNTWASETASSAHHKLLDHMGRKVGTTFTEQTDKSTLWGYKVIGSYQLGDGITYYGNGHNSVLHDDDGNWYLVEHCRKQMGGYANLQVRKMLWNEDGWPVVSPLVYAGEKEQEIPIQMIAGTWDLSSVGRTILDSSTASVGSGSDEKVDLPVLSSKLIFALDSGVYKQDGECVGTWEFDGDHTVTISFDADGDNDNYEFYQAGDTMKLYVLTGYDKDQRESALVMTGTDQNNITNFAKKATQTAQIAKKINRIATTPTVVEKSTLGNPILGFDADGNTMYAGDPAALVDGDTVYIYAGHDTSTAANYVMPEWVCYSSNDMQNWAYEGVTMKATDVSWRSNDTSAWASQVIKYGDKYYMYFCTWDKNSSGKQSIGVAVSDSPTGPFVDKGTPLVKGTLTEPQANSHDDIDPTVWVETVDGEEHRYLAWGNTKFYVCELNEDMTSVKDLNGDNQIKMNDDIKEQVFNNLPDGLVFTEAPWIYRRTDADGNYTGKYYMFGAFGWREQMGYATSDTMYGPWEWGGVIMPPTATSNTNHPSVIDFKGKTYFIYHNGSLPWGSGFRRSVCVALLYWENDGTIRPIDELSTGPNYSEAVRIALSSDVFNDDRHYLAHEEFVNPSDDASYPLKRQLVMNLYEVHNGPNLIGSLEDMWQIKPAKYDSENENYVSIESYDKAGLYITADGTNVILTQQDTLSTALAKKMTFKTVMGINGQADSVSFESVAKKGYFITMTTDGVTLTDGTDADACSFKID